MIAKPDNRYLRNFRHGYRTRPEYNSWRNMKSRCSNPNNNRYASHGGRGIKVCERWLNSFPNFLADMGDRPGKKYSLDRIDNDGDYTLENCRWATSKEQANNRRNNTILEHDGKAMTLAQWADETGLSIKLIWGRYSKGLSASDVLSIIPLKRGPK